MSVLRGPRKQEVRILEGKPHLCSTIGGVIIKDLGEYNANTRKICGSPIYTEKQLEEKHQSIEDKIKEGLEKEEKERLAIMKQKEERRKQKEFEDKIRREREELELREREAAVKKIERQNEKYRRVGDDEIVKISSSEKVDEKVEDKIEEKKEEVKKEIKVEIPKITVTTTTNTPVSNGTGTIFSEGTNIVSVPKIGVEKKVEKKVGVEKKVEEKKVEKKVEKNIIDDYIDILYGGT